MKTFTLADAVADGLKHIKLSQQDIEKILEIMVKLTK